MPTGFAYPVRRVYGGEISLARRNHIILGAQMKSRFWLVLLVAMGALLTGVTAADAQVPSGERQLGRTIIEPGYDDRTGELIYIMTPMGTPSPSHANAHAISPLFIVVYPNAAADAVGTMNCAHAGDGPECLWRRRLGTRSHHERNRWQRFQRHVAGGRRAVHQSRCGEDAHHDRSATRRRHRRGRCFLDRHADDPARQHGGEGDVRPGEGAAARAVTRVSPRRGRMVRGVRAPAGLAAARIFL